MIGCQSGNELPLHKVLFHQRLSVDETEAGGKERLVRVIGGFVIAYFEDTKNAMRYKVRLEYVRDRVARRRWGVLSG